MHRGFWRCRDEGPLLSAFKALYLYGKRLAFSKRHCKHCSSLACMMSQIPGFTSSTQARRTENLILKSPLKANRSMKR